MKKYTLGLIIGLVLLPSVTFADTTQQQLVSSITLLINLLEQQVLLLQQEYAQLMVATTTVATTTQDSIVSISNEIASTTIPVPVISTIIEPIINSDTNDISNIPEAKCTISVSDIKQIYDAGGNKKYIVADIVTNYDVHYLTATINGVNAIKLGNQIKISTTTILNMDVHDNYGHSGTCSDIADINSLQL